jgi:hypothetical protein
VKGDGTARWLWVFPSAWRKRYGDELAALIEDVEHDDDLRVTDRLDVVRAGLQTRAGGRRRRVTTLATAGAATLAITLAALTLAGALSSSPSPSSRCSVEINASTGKILLKRGDCGALPQRVRGASTLLTPRSSQGSPSHTIYLLPAVVHAAQGSVHAAQGSQSKS